MERGTTPDDWDLIPELKAAPTQQTSQTQIPAKLTKEEPKYKYIYLFEDRDRVRLAEDAEKATTEKKHVDDLKELEVAGNVK